MQFLGSCNRSDLLEKDKISKCGTGGTATRSGLRHAIVVVPIACRGRGAKKGPYRRSAGVALFWEASRNVVPTLLVMARGTRGGPGVPKAEMLPRAIGTCLKKHVLALF